MGDTVYGVFSPFSQVTPELRTLVYKPATGWTTSQIESGSAGYEYPTISSSRTGVYYYWHLDNYASAWMKRKVYPISGSVAENMFFTGYNWVTGDLTIESGATVTAKTGSVTYVLANKMITVNSGGTLIVEPGATFNFESGASIEVNGTLTVQAPTPPSTQRAMFTSSGPNVTWGGIVVENGSSTASASLSYVDIVNTGTALRVDADVEFAMDHCVVDGAVEGLEIPQPATAPTSAKQVTHNKFNNISGYGMLIYSFSDLTITDDTCSGDNGSIGIACFASSPSPVLRNRIYGFKTGLYCDEGSSPVLENGRFGGYNKIIKNETGVESEDGTPVLGFISGMPDDWGGQNDIYDNSYYDVDLKGGTVVEAENNWWGTSGDPKNQFNDPDGILDYDPWLTTDPNPNRPFGGSGTPGIVGAAANSQGKLGGSGLILTPGLGQLARLALEKRTNGEFAEAAAILKTIVADTAYGLNVKTWAIKQLLAVAQRLKDPANAVYMRNLLAACPSLTRHIKAVLPFAFLNEGAVEDAMAAFDDNLELGQDRPRAFEG